MIINHWVIGIHYFQTNPFGDPASMSSLWVALSQRLYPGWVRIPRPGPEVYQGGVRGVRSYVLDYVAELCL